MYWSLCGNRNFEGAGSNPASAAEARSLVSECATRFKSPHQAACTAHVAAGS